MPSLPTSSPESGFTPRKEFIREQKHTTNSFSLLTIAGSNCIRLYSFPQSLVASLRRFLDQRRIVSGFREDVIHNFCEFTLEGKPWANSKSLATERLLMELLTIVYQHGYSYLSTIDYGREHDDRLAMAFSTPLATRNSFRSDSPASPIIPNASKVTLPESRPKRVPFALSFPSATLLRVICPPLHSTPAILQAVRGSWPRGVVSEKKVGGNSWEFKLKGYRWFQEDTFATDSLHHILSLLSSLDAHAFSLLTSISLTNNRSRVKDLWIFTGPAPTSTDEISPTGSSASLLNSSHPELKRAVYSPELLPYKSSPSSMAHRRLASESSVAVPGQIGAHHPRAATDGAYHLHPGGSSSNQHIPPPSPGRSNSLRKPAPRAQVPVSVHDTDAPEPEVYRANLPSIVSEGVENMTGVGAGGSSPPPQTPDIFYATSPFGPSGSSAAATASSPDGTSSPVPGAESSHAQQQMAEGASVARPAETFYYSASPTPAQEMPTSVPQSDSPNASSQSSSASGRGTPATPQELLSPHVFRNSSLGSTPSSGPGTPGTPQELLSPHVFRDSAFSTNSDMSSEIPIKWTGSGRESNTPNFPGGWQPTPIEEKNEADVVDSQHRQMGLSLEQNRHLDEPVQQLLQRVGSPISEPKFETRKSETGVIGMMASAEPSTPPVPSSPKGKEKESSESSGKGWVLVNVEGKDAPGESVASPAEGGATSNESVVQEKVLSKEDGPKTESPAPVSSLDVSSSNDLHPQASMSPAAKAIVIIDAVDAKKSKSSKDDTEPAQSPSRIRKFFSLSRRDSKKAQEAVSRVEDKKKDKSKLRNKLGAQDKQKQGSMQEATRSDSRRSIDG